MELLKSGLSWTIQLSCQKVKSFYLVHCREHNIFGEKRLQIIHKAQKGWMQSSEVFTVGPWRMGLRKFLQSIDQLYCKWSKLSWMIQCLCWLQSLKASIRSVYAIYTYPTICTGLMLKSILLFTYSQGKDIMSFSFINCQMLKPGPSQEYVQGARGPDHTLLCKPFPCLRVRWFGCT
jgi:hypothetical protein